MPINRLMCLVKSVRCKSLEENVLEPWVFFHWKKWKRQIGECFFTTSGRLVTSLNVLTASFHCSVGLVVVPIIICLSFCCLGAPSGQGTAGSYYFCFVFLRPGVSFLSLFMDATRKAVEQRMFCPEAAVDYALDGLSPPISFSDFIKDLIKGRR